MKNLSAMILGFLIGATLLGSLAIRQHSATAAGSFQSTYTYRLMNVTTSNIANQQSIINSWAANGWEMVTVDDRTVYFRKRVR